IGYHLTFLPMHITGLNGMQRRVFTYDVADGLALTNMLSTIGAFIMGISMLFLFYNLFKTHRKNEAVGSDPWDARTLEWTVASPAPEHTFSPMPVIGEFDAFWYAKQRGETLKTTTNHRAAPIAKDSLLPFLIASSLGVLGICLIY